MPAVAENWTKVYEYSGMIVFVDTDAVVRTQDIATIPVRFNSAGAPRIYKFDCSRKLFSDTGSPIGESALPIFDKACKKSWWKFWK